jgi:hypothetical protein
MNEEKQLALLIKERAEISAKLETLIEVNLQLYDMIIQVQSRIDKLDAKGKNTGPNWSD